MRELVELGSGTASKTRALLYAMAAAGTLDRYVPFDVDESVVKASAEELAELYPGLAVHGVVGDFERDLGAIPDGERRLFAFLGGTIGNLEPEQRARFLAGVRGLLGPTDRLILGTDLVKDTAMLEAAYDDSEGVTAEFNLNVLQGAQRAAGRGLRPGRLRARGRVRGASSSGSRCGCARCATRRSRSRAPGSRRSSPRARRCSPRSAASSRPQRIAQELTAAGLEPGRADHRRAGAVRGDGRHAGPLSRVPPPWS